MFTVTFQKYRKTDSKTKNSYIIPLRKIAAISILIHTFARQTHTPV